MLEKKKIKVENVDKPKTTKSRVKKVKDVEVKQDLVVEVPILLPIEAKEEVRKPYIIKDVSGCVCPNCSEQIEQKDLRKDIQRKKYYCVKCKDSYLSSVIKNESD